MLDAISPRRAGGARLNIKWVLPQARMASSQVTSSCPLGLFCRWLPTCRWPQLLRCSVQGVRRGCSPDAMSCAIVFNSTDFPTRLGLEAGRSRPAPDSRERWPNTRTGALRARIRSGSLRIQVCNSVHPPVGTGTLRSDLTTPVRAAVMTEPHDVSSPRRLCALNACSGNPTRSRLEPLGRRPRDGRTAQP